MATTTNYSWTTPDDTALVKDGASAIRTLGSSVDTTTKNLNPSTTLGDIEYRSSTSNTNTRVGIGSSGQALTVVAGVPSWAASSTSTLTTTGDTLYASAANTLARRAIGSTGDVLTVSGGLPTWAAPSGGANYSLINAGGTALTGAQTITISGISGKQNLYLRIDGCSSASASLFGIQINGDTTSSYISRGITTTNAAIAVENATSTSFPLVATSAGSGTMDYGVHIFGCSTAGYKTFQVNGFSNNNTAARQANGIYLGSAALTSVSIFSGTGNFDAGTIYVYGG